MTTYNYSQEFRLKLMALLLDTHWMSRVGMGVASPDYYATDEEQEVAKAILDYWKTYNKPPYDPEEVIIMCDGNHRQLVYELYDLHETGEDRQFVKDIAVQWAREQAAKIAILEGVDDVKRGNLQQVILRMEKALDVGKELMMPGIDVIDDIALWLYSEYSDRTRTGWFHVDQRLEGGLSDGEQLVILAPSNRGKTMSLVNCAYGAAGIGSAKNVVIFTHELSPEKYAKRFGARLLFRFPSPRGDLHEYEADLTAVAKRLMPGRVRVIGGYRMTISEIEQHVRRLQAEGFKIGMMIDDYPDLIIPERSRNQTRFELSEIYMWLRDFGARKENRFPTIGASQVGRAAYTKEIITETDVAEDIGKVNTADVVLTLCQTREEALENRCRLYAAKVRDGERGFMVAAKYYGKQQAIITTGYVDQKVVEEDV